MSRTFARLSASKTALANDPGILTTDMKPICCGLPFISIRREIALLAPPQREIAEARHVIGVDEHAASPMAPTGHRLHRLAVDHNPGIIVAEPAPGVGRSL